MTREQAPPDLTDRIDALHAAVTALEKQIGRAGREQFKANALAETQAERLAAAIDALRNAEERREAENTTDRQQSQAALAEARIAVARAMFPAIDGLDEAIRSGRATLDHAARRESAETLLRRLLLGSDDTDALSAAFEAWLAGLTMVRRRLLDALAAEGVTLIAAEGLPFDPRRHIAVEVVTADVAPGMVVQEIRRGFAVGARVLRHTEVAVAGEPQE
jgi:molecular chaperone GrpE